jgi:hypothetical protein
MNILGIALIVCGLITICASVIFLWIVGREPPRCRSRLKKA